MATSELPRSDIMQTVTKAVGELVRAEFIGNACFVNLPMHYPDGSFVTVKISRNGDVFRVSDAGFAFREAEELDQIGLFRRSAQKAVEKFGVSAGKHEFFADATIATIQSAIIDVAAASQRVAEEVCDKGFEEDERAIAAALTSRLERLFGIDRVQRMKSVSGMSSNEWRMSALVQLPDHLAVFQAVSERPSSIYRTATAFHDLASLPSPPRLVAVVRDKSVMGRKVALLSQAGNVIEEMQSDDSYRRAAD